MKLLLLAIVAALSSSAVANRHHKCYCYSNADDGLYEPDNEKTTKMCDSYKKRIGNKFYEWDTCPDCKYEVVEDYVDEGTPPGWCSSAGKHLGGKEVHDYCTQAQAMGSRCGETPREVCGDHYCNDDDNDGY